MLAKELASLNNEVTFLTTQPAAEFHFPLRKEFREGVKIIAFADFVPDFMRRTGFGVLSFIIKIFYIILNDFDIYHSDAGHRPNGGLAILFKSVFVKITYVCEWWDYFGKGGQYDTKQGIKKYTHGVYDLLFEVYEKRKADGVICLSGEMKRRGIRLGIPEENLTVINGGSDVNKIFFNERSVYREKYGIESDALVFGFVGMTKAEVNDVIPFMQALNELVSEYEKFSGIVVMTTGGYISSTVISKLNLKFRLKELGWLTYSDFSTALNCADVFVLLQKPNLQNKSRWPNKLGDYLAAGRKTIMNPIGDSANLIEKYKELFIKVEYNVPSIKKVLLKAYDDGSFYRDRALIRSIAMKDFSWHKRAIQMNKFFHSILERREEKVYAKQIS